ncbi:MAG: FAD binding domain-containing protein, partial [Myxococcota bacterium]|nr:FAD binding domain-containing protein [Myxococcota bacterium]
MMPLPPFDLAQPKLVDDAVALLAQAGDEGRILAGGTDLLVNMKQGIESPRLLVSLSDLPLRGVQATDDGGLVIGAGELLDVVATHRLVRERAPAVA